MSQQVLARKWRPTTFEQLIGQEHVRKALSHALDSGRLHHAYLFTGTRGVGKTTIARILARCLNCERGVSSTPCGECANCRAISDNRFVDLLEVDAASRTKVDDTRELLENVSYAPSQGRYKVYLIDEVHMLTTHSFNALLKTLEEPPGHVVFLLATTDPQKLLPTVLSRCLQFHLRDLSPDVVESYLQHVLSEEQVVFESDALWHLAKAGRGSVRDAMTLLDQAIAHGEGSVTASNVIEMLGTQGISEIPALLKDIALGQSVEALERIAQLSRETPDWMALVSGMQSMLHQVAITQINPNGIGHLSPSEQKAVRELAEVMSPEFLQLAYQFALTGYRDLPLASDSRSAFEMLVLRMIAFRPARSGEVIVNHHSVQSEQAAEPKSEPEPAHLSDAPAEHQGHEYDAQNDSNKQGVHGNSVEHNAENTHEPSSPTPDDSRFESSVALDTLTDQVTTDNQAPATPDAQNPVIAENISPQILSGLADIEASFDETIDDGFADSEKQELSLSPEAWVRECSHLNLHGMTASLIAQTVLLSVGADEVVLAANAHTDSLLNDMHRRRVSEAFADVLERAPVIRIEVQDDLGETPERYRSRLKAERLELAKTQFSNEPFVRVLTDRFDGTVRIESVQPKDGDTHV